MQKIVSLSKRRGFVFQSSEIYGGLKSSYDFGPLGVELKRNISASWWRSMVHERDDVVGIDASIIMHPNVWRASGHLSGFSDPLVDCLNCGERFRGDKAPRAEAGSPVKYIKGGGKKGESITGTVDKRGYICPACGSSALSDERQFNLMFRTFMGAVDPIDAVIDVTKELHEKGLTKAEIREKVAEVLSPSTVYLRPETAQAMFVQFLNVQQSCSMKVPFGIAQIGRSFRNEVTVEHFIFRSCEFEQMEMEFFVEPGTQVHWLEYWSQNRLKWWQNLSNSPEKFILRQHEKDELAHYADNCYDIEYQYPWGFGELEGVASRTDYDLTKHSKESGVKLSYFDQNKNDPNTGKPGWRYTPYVIEPAAGLSRAVLCFLLDAYREEEGVDAEGNVKVRTLLKLHPTLAPIKVAVLPLVKKDNLPELAKDIVAKFYKAGINASYDEQHSIGKRYAKHDEIGTPYCLTIDHASLENNSVTIRDRDTTLQERISINEALDLVKNRLAS